MRENEMKLDNLNNPDRFEEIAQLHTKAFRWEPQGRIPLGIHVVNREYAKGLDYNEWLNPKPFLDLQTRILADTLAVGSDLLPVVAINHLGDAVLTSMFGAKQKMPEEGFATLQDVGPTPLPIFSSICEAADLEMPGPDSGIMPDIKRMVCYYREALPSWVHVVAPMPAGPLSTAMELRGSDFILDMIDHPDLCSRLINICARLQAEVERQVRLLSGEPLDHHVSNFGILGPGLRLGDDSMVMLSPAMIKEFCLPAYATVNRLCGGRGHIHFCSLPHSRFDHLYSVLAEGPEVAVISSQFGFEYYEQHLDDLRGRLAVEAFYGDAYSYVCQKYGSFRTWAESFVPRFKNESGLVLYFQVESIQEGRELWAIWQKAHNI